MQAAIAPPYIATQEAPDSESTRLEIVVESVRSLGASLPAKIQCLCLIAAPDHVPDGAEYKNEGKATEHESFQHIRREFQPIPSPSTVPAR